MKRYPTDAKKVRHRARWQVRFSTALRQLKKENCISQDEELGPMYQEGRISKRDVYSLTELGKSFVNDYKL